MIFKSIATKFRKRKNIVDDIHLKYTLVDKDEMTFLSGWFIALFFSGVVAIGILFFPKYYLYNLLLKIKVGQPVALFYLSQYEIMYPKNISIHVARAKQAIFLEKYDLANIEINWLAANTTENTEVKLLRFELQYYQAYGLPKGAARNNAIADLQKIMPQFITLPMRNDQLLVLASIALKIEMPAAALALYERISNLKDPELLREIGATALQTSQYKISAKYYLMASENETYLDDKRTDIISALEALQSGNYFDDGIAIITSLPDKVIENKEMLVFLTQYTLAAKRPDLSQEFARRALMMKGVIK